MGQTAGEHFDCIIVGSGFGGAVSAYRLAEAGRSVLLLERGKAYPPGSFPRSPHGIKRNLWDPSEGLHGMFDAWAFSDLDALVCSGLGGGSLIYANVMLRKDERWFVREDHSHGAYEHWPVTREELEPHYDRAEAMLGATPYPLDRAPYDRTAKTVAFKAAAESAGLDWQLPPLAVTFAPGPGEEPVPGEPIREPRPNLHGRTRQTCRLCGECDFGCNYGAKNTLDYTYLTAAWHAGAELRTRAEVRAFAPREGGGWSVRLRRARRGGRGAQDRHASACRRSRSPPTGSCSAAARSARPTCCCATAPRCPASPPRSATASPATATCSRSPCAAARPASAARERRGSSTRRTAR